MFIITAKSSGIEKEPYDVFLNIKPWVEFVENPKHAMVFKTRETAEEIFKQIKPIISPWTHNVDPDTMMIKEIE